MIVISVYVLIVLRVLTGVGHVILLERLQAQLLGYVAPAEQTIYREWPNNQTGLNHITDTQTGRLIVIKNENGVSSFETASTSLRLYFMNLGYDIDYFHNDVILYMGARRSGRGAPPKLVVVARPAKGYLESTFRTGVRTFVVSPGRPPQRPIQESCEYGAMHCAANDGLARGTGDFRLLAGRPDPLDDTHFTIEYIRGETHGVIDGWLRENRVELRVRNGPGFDASKR